MYFLFDKSNKVFMRPLTTLTQIYNFCSSLSNPNLSLHNVDKAAMVMRRGCSLPPYHQAKIGAGGFPFPTTSGSCFCFYRFSSLCSFLICIVLFSFSYGGAGARFFLAVGVCLVVSVAVFSTSVRSTVISGGFSLYQSTSVRSTVISGGFSLYQYQPLSWWLWWSLVCCCGSDLVFLNLVLNCGGFSLGGGVFGEEGFGLLLLYCSGEEGFCLLW
jgi:hypothetical protein